MYLESVLITLSKSHVTKVAGCVLTNSKKKSNNKYVRRDKHEIFFRPASREAQQERERNARGESRRQKQQSQGCSRIRSARSWRADTGMNITAETRQKRRHQTCGQQRHTFQTPQQRPPPHSSQPHHTNPQPQFTDTSIQTHQTQFTYSTIFNNTITNSV